MKHKTACLFPSIISIIGMLGTFQMIDATQPPVSERKINTGDATLFVRVVGDPSKSLVLVTLSGGPGLSSHYMEGLEELAGSDLTIVTFDQRGTGRSTAGEDGYALENYVADVETIRKHLKREHIFLFGHSFGGVLALRYTSLHPQRVSGLILMGSGPPCKEAVVPAQQRLGLRLHQLVERGIISGQEPETPSEVINYIMPGYFSDPEFPTPREIRQTSFHAEVSQRTLIESGDWDFRPGLKVIQCPVLFLWGEDDPFGKELADETREALVNAKLIDITLEKCGHFWQENEEEFSKQIKRFLGQF
jgi:proline iminopeptidase